MNTARAGRCIGCGVLEVGSTARVLSSLAPAADAMLAAIVGSDGRLVLERLTKV